MARTIHGIDLTTPGGIEALMAFHRLTFGDAVMEGEEGGGEDNTGGDGGEGGDGTGEGADGGQEGGESLEGEDALGDAGKRALDAMKAQLKAAKAEKAAALAELKGIKDAAELGPDEQKLAQARQEAAAEATAKANERILKADIKAAAAGKLKNPAIAVKLLDLTQFEADGDGNFDQSDIEAAIGELLKTDPYLAAQGGTVQFDSGRGKQAPAGQLTKEQLDKLSPAEVMKANREGRLKNLLKK